MIFSKKLPPVVGAPVGGGTREPLMAEGGRLHAVTSNVSLGSSEPNASASTPISRRRMNSPLPASCDTTILAGNGGFNRRRLPSASPSTPTERRGYIFSSSRIVATSLCRGAEGPSAPTSTPSPLLRARLHAVTSNVSLGSSELSGSASTPTSRRRMNSHTSAKQTVFSS